MVLDLPGGLFGQDDVRETATVTAGTSYWSVSGIEFLTVAIDTDDVTRSATGGQVTVQAGTENFMVSVDLPHGATITNVVVYGSDTADIWSLYEAINNGGAAGTVIATATINTEDTSITNPIVNNSIKRYWLLVAGVATGEDVYGARITYTT